MQVSEIIENIKRLSDDDLSLLMEWIENYEQRIWDEKLEQDIKSGKLDKLSKQAIQDFKNGKCQEL